jgi:pSer/pThr/pTyr-binding forkhead associated (FHA) protein
MGALFIKANNRKITLRMKTLIGRDATCDVRVDHPKVSHEHASLRWRDSAWELRDLGSVNGTFVGTRRLAPGERAQLELGATFSVANSDAVFELVDDSPPAAAALHRASGRLHLATGGILVLPSEEQPRMTLFASSDGKWSVEI